MRHKLVGYFRQQDFSKGWNCDKNVIDKEQFSDNVPGMPLILLFILLAIYGTLCWQLLELSCDDRKDISH